MKPSDRIREIGFENVREGKHLGIPIKHNALLAILDYLDEQHEESQELSQEILDELKTREQQVAEGAFTDTSVGSPELETVVPGLDERTMKKLEQFAFKNPDMSIENLLQKFQRKLLREEMRAQKKKQPLKTLKDFGFIGQGGRWEPAVEGYHRGFQARLRAEAIRKVKAIDECEVGLYIMGGFHVKRDTSMEMVRKYIMWQNNIAEDDLQ